MVQLKCRYDSKNNYTPILSKAEIDNFANDVLADYKPSLLQEPGKIRFEHFLESYLGATVAYQDIYSDDPNHPILGAVAFSKGMLRVFDYDNGCISKIQVDPHTVIIDNEVMNRGKEGLALFTGLHEAGHLLLHTPTYRANIGEGQTKMWESGVSGVMCRKSNIENFASRKNCRTASDWLEFQADYFAAALAMPNATFHYFVRQIMRENGAYKTQIRLGADWDMDYVAKTILPSRISEVYGVSKQAAFIKLKTAGFVVDNSRTCA